MDQNSLKTSFKQRLAIIVIAVLLLGSTIAAYVAIVVSSGNSSSLEELERKYTAVQDEITEYATSTLSGQYFDELASYRSQIKAYNAEAANGVGVQTTDLKEGTGRELTADDNNYFAYYIGWCPDESVFDSSFDNATDPTAVSVPIYAGQGLIEGWNKGVVGMKIGGVREIQMPGELAYGESREVCGTTNSPLKFIVMPIADAKLSELEVKLEDAYSKLIQAYYASSAANSAAAGSSDGSGTVVVENGAEAGTAENSTEAGTTEGSNAE